MIRIFGIFLLFFHRTRNHTEGGLPEFTTTRLVIFLRWIQGLFRPQCVPVLKYSLSAIRYFYCLVVVVDVVVVVVVAAAAAANLDI